MTEDKKQSYLGVYAVVESATCLTDARKKALEKGTAKEVMQIVKAEYLIKEKYSVVPIEEDDVEDLIKGLKAASVYVGYDDGGKVMMRAADALQYPERFDDDGD